MPANLRKFILGIIEVSAVGADGRFAFDLQDYFSGICRLNKRFQAEGVLVPKTLD